MGNVTVLRGLGSVLPTRVAERGQVAPSPEPLVLRLKCGSFGEARLWSVSPVYEMWVSTGKTYNGLAPMFGGSS